MQAPRSLPWTDAPERLQLRAGEAHVWRATLEVEPPRINDLRRLLSEDERQRADRLVGDTPRRRFTASRGLLRSILGRYLAIAPDRLRFAYGEHGKPRLSDELRAASLEFNLAHSNDLAIYAFTAGQRVGVDIERVRDGVDAESIATRFFSTAEVAAIRTAPESDRQELFFRQWTRKEAYVKALGLRMWDALDTDLAVPASAVSQHLSLCTLDVGPGYAATIAIEGQEPRLSYWQLRVSALG